MSTRPELARRRAGWRRRPGARTPAPHRRRPDGPTGLHSPRRRPEPSATVPPASATPGRGPGRGFADALARPRSTAAIGSVSRIRLGLTSQVHSLPAIRLRDLREDLVLDEVQRLPRQLGRDATAQRVQEQVAAAAVLDGLVGGEDGEAVARLQLLDGGGVGRRRRRLALGLPARVGQRLVQHVGPDALPVAVGIVVHEDEGHRVLGGDHQARLAARVAAGGLVRLPQRRIRRVGEEVQPEPGRPAGGGLRATAHEDRRVR